MEGEMDNAFDVIVIGGGTAGVIAAIQSARADHKTLLIEKNALPGGTMTAGAIGVPGLFHAWKKQIIAGIGWELVSQASAESGYSLPDFEQQTGNNDFYTYQINVNPLIYALLCEEKMIAAGVNILYHTMLADLTIEKEGLSITICTREGLRKFHAKRLIDCTGDAYAVAMAGYEVIHPFPCQPASICCNLSGYDYKKLDWGVIRNAADKALAAGELKINDLSYNTKWFPSHFLKLHGMNSNHVFPEIPPHSAEGRSALEQSAHRTLLRAYRFLRKQPGLENLKMEMTAFECGVRESAVIKGIYTITGEDYTAAKKYPDALCNAYYPIDIHSESGVGPHELNQGLVPQVPLRALIPEKSEFILAAGRCISSDREANSALRVQATCMATAQAAAAAVCVSIRENVPVSQASLENVRGLLKQNGAIVP